MYADDNNRRYIRPGGTNPWVYTLYYKEANHLDLYNKSSGVLEDGKGSVFECPSNGLPPRGRKTLSAVNDLWIIDHYSITTHLEDWGSRFKGDFSPKFLGDGEGVLFSESVIWMNGDSTWTSNHSYSGRGNVYTRLKKNPRVY